MNEAEQVTISKPRRRWFRFGLKTLFVILSVTCALLVLVPLVPPQVTIWTAATLPAPALTTLMLIRRRFHKPLARSLVFATIAAWLLVYVASIGPAAAVLQWTRMESNPIALKYSERVYAPVFWAYANTPLGKRRSGGLRPGPIEWYVDYWQHLGMRLR